MNEADKLFWLDIYRGIMQVAAAIKKYKLDRPPPDETENRIQAAPLEAAPPNNIPPINGALVSK